MRVAESIAGVLASTSGIEGVYVFGSVARGDATADSDIDLIVVGDRSELSSRKVRKLVPPQLRSLRPSVAFYTLEELDALLSAKASFADHLVSEGQILFDREGRLRRLLDAHTGLAFEVGVELQFELRRLRHLEDTEQFNGNFLFCLAHLYVIGKAVVMLVLKAEGTPEYNKSRSFQSLAARHPELTTEAESLAQLKPFYLRVTRRSPEAFPFSYRDADERVKRAIAGVRRIAAVAL